MNKLIILLRKKPGMSMRQFMEYYEDVHIPFVKTVLPSLGSRYVRNYLTHPPILADGGLNPAPYFDVITELWFDRKDEYDGFIARLNDKDTYSVLREDQEKFLDTSIVQIIPVTELGDA